MVAERESARNSLPSSAMARPFGSDLRPLGEEIMEAVQDDLAGNALPLGVGLGVGGQLAQQAESPTGRRGFSGLPRTPVRAGVLAFTPPRAGGGVQETQEEVMQASAVTGPRAAEAEQNEEENGNPGHQEVIFLSNTPSTPESHRVFAADDETVSRGEFKKLRGQLKETRDAVREMASRHQQELQQLKLLIRYNQRANGVARDLINDVKLQVATQLKDQHTKLVELEDGFKSLDAWADDTATRADPDALWQDLDAKNAQIADLEVQIANLRGDLNEAKGNGGTGSGFHFPEEPSEDAQELRRRIERLEQSTVHKTHSADGGGGGGPGRKPISEFKVIQSITPLVEDKSKFREWNNKFINAMEQVDTRYGAALANLIKWADAESVPDMESGWPGDSILQEAGLAADTGNRSASPSPLNVAQLDKDLKGVLIEKPWAPCTPVP